PAHRSPSRPGGAARTPWLAPGRSARQPARTSGPERAEEEGVDLSRDASDASDDENVSRVGDVRGLAPPPCALGEGATMLQLQAAGAGASRSSRGEPGV